MGSNRYTWAVKEVIKETPDALSIVFDTGGVVFSYSAGQFINITIDIDGGFVTRPYSLSSGPATDADPVITIKRVDGGILSNYILEHASEVTTIEVEGPFGSFVLTEESYNKECHVLIAGGSGITPILSMVKSLLHQTTSKVILFYSNRNIGSTIGYDLLLKIVRQHANRLEIIFAFSNGPEFQDDSINIISGRFNRLLLKKLLRQYAQFSNDSIEFFMCGPEALMQMHSKVIQDVYGAEARIRREYFIAPDEVNPEPILQDKVYEVLVHFKEQTNLLEVNPGSSILDAARAEHIPIPHSCLRGNCGACTAKLLSGKALMKSNYALPKEEVDQGWLLLCQAFPVDNEVVIEMN